MEKITFGMIILNGEPFLRYNLRALYPFAHQIIVAEGASPLAAHAASEAGHSIDGTLETLRSFQEQEDPDGKVIVVTAEDEGYPNGFWPGEKDEQSQAYAKRATGDWLWQIDCDEFYRRHDMAEICSLLESGQPSMIFLYLKVFMYHARLEIRGVEPEYCQCQPIARIFRWGPGYQYVTHRPPTVVDAQGNDLRHLNPMLASEAARRGWYIWHYPFLYRHQFASKAQYYDRLGFRGSAMGAWARDAEMIQRPKFAVLWQGLSWLVPVSEAIPEPIEAMQREHGDYEQPAYLKTFSYRMASLIARLYLAALIYWRTQYRAIKWFAKPYGKKGADASANQNAIPGHRSTWAYILTLLPPMRIRRVIGKQARFLGILGYRPF